MDIQSVYRCSVELHGCSLICCCPAVCALLAYTLSLSLQWVYNILEGRAEAERVIYNDPDPLKGFVLLPDMKWDQSDVKSLYMLAIVRRKGLTCMRELSYEHLPLLKNVLEAGKVSEQTCPQSLVEEHQFSLLTNNGVRPYTPPIGQ